MPYKDPEVRRAHQRAYQQRTKVLTGRVSLAVRFWRKVDKSGGDDACWLWTAALSVGNRYGGFFVGGHTRPAHRVAYELTISPIAAGLELDHLCRNTRCVNPAHLEPVTHQENVRRGASMAVRTHCHKGHPKPAEADVRGERRCLTCQRDRTRVYRARRREGLA